MTTLTGKQAGKLIELFADTQSEQIQALFASGLLTDLRDGNIEKVNREEFRRVLGIIKPLNLPTDPLAAFFETRKGLWVSKGFRERVLSPALEMEETAPASVGEPLDLSKNMIDDEIRKELGENHVFENPRAFLTMLVYLIDKQWGGAQGTLRANGYANIFYVRGRNEKGEEEVFVVSVDWYAGHGGWRAGACRLDDSSWFEGDRAFPSN